MTAKARFTAAEIARAVSGAKSGGMEVGRVEVWPNGKIVVVSAGWSRLEERNPRDEVLDPDYAQKAVARAYASAAALRGLRKKV